MASRLFSFRSLTGVVYKHIENMRLTAVVCRQHIGRMTRLKWRVFGKREAIVDPAYEKVMELGIPINDVSDILEEKREFIKVDIQAESFIPKPIVRDRTHPHYHDRVCLMYKDHNVLLKGLEQSQVLTKTVEIKKGLPEDIEKLVGSEELPDQDTLVKRSILASHVFDAMQEKLPKIKDPERPAWNFPRVYGITHKRKNHLLSTKLIHLCEAAVGKNPALLGNRMLLSDHNVVTSVEKDGDLIQIDITADQLLLSSSPLPVYADNKTVKETCDISLPDLYPVKHTITLEPDHIYGPETFYAAIDESKFHHVHTAVIHFDSTEVNNLYETPVTEEQVLGRTLMKAFAIAASQAKRMFGADVKDLPKPITLQCIHTDGHLFHFTVLQLNTLNLDGMEGRKNILWSLPRIPLFTTCMYEKGIPVLEGYNDEVFSRMLAFYINGLQLT